MKSFEINGEFTSEKKTTSNKFSTLFAKIGLDKLLTKIGLVIVAARYGSQSHCCYCRKLNRSFGLAGSLFSREIVQVNEWYVNLTLL